MDKISIIIFKKVIEIAHDLGYAAETIYLHQHQLVLKEERMPRKDSLDSHVSMGPVGHFGAHGPIVLGDLGKSWVIKISTE